MSGSEFQRVGRATEKTRVPAWVLSLGTDNITFTNPSTNHICI